MNKYSYNNQDVILFSKTFTFSKKISPSRYDSAGFSTSFFFNWKEFKAASYLYRYSF